MKRDYKEDETDAIAQELLNHAQTLFTDRSSAALIALQGDLGAGKTTLAQAVAKILGVKENVISPTYILMKKYEIVHPLWSTLVHIDAYRIEEESELARLGWVELLSQPNTLILLEWPERVAGLMPQIYTEASITHVDTDQRSIEMVEKKAS